MPAIFDSHAHYDAEAFDEDRDALLASLPGKNVVGVVNAASDAASAQKSVWLAEKYPFLWAAAGIHPEEAAGAGEEDLGDLPPSARASAGGRGGRDRPRLPL